MHRGGRQGQLTTAGAEFRARGEISNGIVEALLAILYA